MSAWGSSGGWGDTEDTDDKETNQVGQNTDNRASRGNWRTSGNQDSGWSSRSDGFKRTNDNRDNHNDDGWGNSGRGGWGNNTNNDDNETNQTRQNADNRASRGKWRSSGNRESGWGGGSGGVKRTNDNRDDQDDDGWGKKDGGGWGNSDEGGWGNNDGDSGRVKSNKVDNSVTSESGWGNSGGGGWRNRDGDSNRSKSNRMEGAFDTDGGRESSTNANAQEEKPAPYRPTEEASDFSFEAAGVNFNKLEEQTVHCLPDNKIKPIEKFEDSIKSKKLLEIIESQKYQSMTPIQKYAIPAIIDGLDLIACAQTGSGKTAAFLLPVLQTLIQMNFESNQSECAHPYCLVISPTRELARQIYNHAVTLSKDTVIRSAFLYGQIATSFLKNKLAEGCHILVATPGRLKDFVERGWIGFKNIKYVILDEGDRLVDEGFTTVIRDFFNHPDMPKTEDRQTLFFSATFKPDTQVVATEYLRKKNFVFITVGRIGAANENITQEIIKITRTEKKPKLKEILMSLPSDQRTIIFTETKTAADMLAGYFTSLKLSSTSIHGDRHQSQREQAINEFKKGTRRFLISSPVGNRGLDLPKVSLVINYDLPKNIDEYVHRIGRTGRAGHTGRAISFFDETRDADLIADLAEILRGAKQEVPDWMEGNGQSYNDTGESGFNENTDNTAGDQKIEDSGFSAVEDSGWG